MRSWTSRGTVAVAATVIIILVTACGEVSDQDVGDGTEDPDAQPELIDPDGVVTQHEFLLPAPADEVLPYLDEPVDEGVVVIVEHDGSDARVVWAGLSCRIAPEVEVTGDQDGIVVAIDRGPRVVEPGDPCDAVEDSFAVDLIFRDELQAAPVTGRVR